MLRASSSAARAAPSSPSRRRLQPTQGGWQPSMGILFAPAPPEQQLEHLKRPSAAVEAKGWQPGDPIRFDEPEPLVEEAVGKQEKIKGKHAGDPRSRPPVAARSSSSPSTSTRATLGSTSRSSSPGNTTASSTQSWGVLSHRWQPPSPSLTSTPRADLSTSTRRFSPNASYAQVGQLARPSSPFRGTGHALSFELDTSRDEALFETELRSVTATRDEWAGGKVDKAVQVGTPYAYVRGREKGAMSVISPSSPALSQPSLSQVEMDALLEGIDFEDDIEMSEEGEVSLDSVTSFHSALASPPKPQPLAAASPKRPNVVLRSHRHSPPSPLSDSLQPDLFSPQPIAAARRAPSPSPPRFYPSTRPSSSHSTLNIHARAFSTTTTARNLSRDEMMDALEDESSIEILPSKPRAATTSSKGKDKENVITLNSDSDDVEIAPVVAKSAPAPRPLKQTSSSGWFVKPASLVASTPADKASASTASVSKPRPPTKEGSYRYKKQEQHARKREQDEAIRAKYRADFKWDRWGAKKPELIYSRDEKEVERVLATMEGPLGFDLEWVPSTRRGVENKTALAQVCSEDTILLVHVAKMTRFSPSLRALIEDPTRIKLGVQIGGDARKLQRDYPGIQPRGLLELNNVGRTVDPSRFNNRTKPGLVGLQELCGIYLDHYLSKDSAVRQGKWNLDLDDDQIYYAANDVYSSLHIFLALQALARPEHDFLVHVSDNVSTASSWRPPLRKEHAFALASDRSSISSAAASTSAESAGTAPRSPSSPRSHSPTVRQLESYTLWHTSSLPVEQVAITMGVKPVTVVWNILKCLGTEQGSSLDFSDERLLNAVEEVGGGPEKMRNECWEVLRDARRRESVRLGEEEEE